jgi:hypothetical protein
MAIRACCGHGRIGTIACRSGQIAAAAHGTTTCLIFPL